jgi:hypothetical protein
MACQKPPSSSIQSPGIGQSANRMLTSEIPEIGTITGE